MNRSSRLDSDGLGRWFAVFFPIDEGVYECVALALEEEVFIPGAKTSDDSVDNRKVTSSKGVRKQANAVDSKGGGSSFVPYVEDKLKLKLKRSSVQTSEVSSILKSDQIDLIASWLPGEREAYTVNK